MGSNNNNNNNNKLYDNSVSERQERKPFADCAMFNAAFFSGNNALSGPYARTRNRCFLSDGSEMNRTG